MCPIGTASSCEGTQTVVIGKNGGFEMPYTPDPLLELQGGSSAYFLK